MTRSGVTFDDSKFRTGVTSLTKDMDRRADLLVAAVGREVAERIAQAAPRASGAMADSVKSEPGRDLRGPYAEISVGPWYSSFQEFGTSTSPAHPFFRPGLEGAPRSVSKLARMLRRA